MDSEIGVVQRCDKIKILLKKLLEPNFDIKNDTHLNLLLSHFSGKDDPDLGTSLIQLPCIAKWINDSIQLWEQDPNVIPSPAVKAFFVHLVSLLSNEETRFNAFSSCNLYARLCSILKIRCSDCPATLTLAYIKLLSSFLEHKSGLQWLVSTDNWQDVLNYALEGQTIYVVRESKNFVYNLLVSSYEFNEEFCTIIIEKISQPLKGINEKSYRNVIDKDNALETQITPILKLILYILHTYFEYQTIPHKKCTISSIFLKNCKLEELSWSILGNFNLSNDLLIDVNKILLLCILHRVVLDSQDATIKKEDVKKLCENTLEVIQLHVRNNAVMNMLEVWYQLSYHLKLIRPTLPKTEANGDYASHTFENQVLIFSLVPIFTVPSLICELPHDITENEFIRETFFAKIFKIMCEKTIHMTCSMRNVLDADKNLFKNSQRSVCYLLKTSKFLSREGAIIAFQTIVYVIRDALDSMKTKPDILAIFSKEIDYFLVHCEAMTTLVKEFEITWHDCLETCCLVNLAMELLSFNFWPQKLVSQLIKLLDMSIGRFMAPNLFLLVERDWTCVKSIGQVLNEKLHSPDWEIRDTSLEFLYTVSEIAKCKFPSFQSMILEFSLPMLTVSISQHDSVSFVRASALRCLQEMIKINKFWTDFLKHQELIQKMISVLYNDPEANVRCEAAKIIVEIFEHQIIEEHLVDDVNKVMVHVAVADLHWEVKLHALDFWDSVIKNRLVNQGMIDGSFPSVTFSKEHRKIVVLTETEIQNRLNKVLIELSNMGCLGVLLATLKDESDLEVAKKTVKIVETFIKLLKLHKVDGKNIAKIQPLSPTKTLPPQNRYNYIQDYNPQVNEHITLLNADDVIDSIVNCQDFGLLAHIRSNGINSASTSIKRESIQIIQPEDFIDSTTGDLGSYVQEKQRWLNKMDNLDSLLDDILKDYNRSTDINAMDCY